MWYVRFFLDRREEAVNFGDVDTTRANENQYERFPTKLEMFKAESSKKNYETRSFLDQADGSRKKGK